PPGRRAGDGEHVATSSGPPTRGVDLVFGDEHLPAVHGGFHPGTAVDRRVLDMIALLHMRLAGVQPIRTRSAAPTGHASLFRARGSLIPQDYQPSSARVSAAGDGATRPRLPHAGEECQVRWSRLSGVNTTPVPVLVTRRMKAMMKSRAAM